MSIKNYHGRKTLVICVGLLFIFGLFIPTIQSQLNKQQKYQYSIDPQESNTIPFRDNSRYTCYLIAQTSNNEFFSSHMKKFFGVATSDARFLTSIEDNHPPEPPTITGPAQGQVGILYLWTLMSNDPENDNVTYYVDWGDRCGAPGLYGPYRSGQEVEVSHTYHYKSTFIINARAIDIYGAESNTTYFEVLMPKNTLLPVPFLLRLLERYPHAFPLLRHFFCL
ncbi:MAG: hypothetical protein JW840_00160 [Candidatus Thermoplasmatota archaeon]|nr:hypothetical protein [Candidatus Thermoplasmatota archaeon]